LLTVGGVGLSPRAPGTLGTLVAAAVDAALLAAGWSLVPVRIGLALAASVGCVALGPWAEKHWGTKDPQAVVLDEVAGYFAAAALCGARHDGATILACFVLFRVGDILKPFPVNRLQGLPHGWGILMDDLAAGVLAGLVVLAGMQAW